MTPTNPVRAFLVDLDGTFYLGNQLLPGAANFLPFLERTGRSALFLTNNSSKNRHAYVKKLAGLGITIQPEQMLTSGEAAARYLQAQAAGARVALFGTPELEQDFREYGFVLDMDVPQYVVLGFDTTITYDKLTRLCDLVRSGLPYIATHPDFNCPTPNGFIPDIGAMIAFVEASTGRRPDIVIGKPNRHILDQASLRLGVPLENVCMIGDRLYTDIAMGQTAPIQTALVLSGETKAHELEASPYKPTYIFENLAEMITFFA